MLDEELHQCGACGARSVTVMLTRTTFERAALGRMAGEFNTTGDVDDSVAVWHETDSHQNVC